MVSDPLAEVAEWAEFCDLIIVHEDAPDLNEVLALIRRCGSRAGVAVMGGHPVPDLDRTVDVLVMSIQPGTAGAPFNIAALDTAREACAVHDRVGLDGGITEDLLEKAVETGVSWVVSGNALVGSSDPGRWVRTRPDDK